MPEVKRAVDDHVYSARADEHPDHRIRYEGIDLRKGERRPTTTHANARQRVTDYVAHDIHDSVPPNVQRSDMQDVRRDVRIGDGRRQQHLRRDLQAQQIVAKGPRAKATDRELLTRRQRDDVGPARHGTHPLDHAEVDEGSP